MVHEVVRTLPVPEDGPVLQDQIIRLASRKALHDHGRQGGPRGLFSLSGVKCTTARRVASDALAALIAWRNRGGLPSHVGVSRPAQRPNIAFDDALWPLDTPAAEATGALRRLVAQEAVQTLDDLLLRRTNWLADPARGASVASAVHRLLDRPPPQDITKSNTALQEH